MTWMVTSETGLFVSVNFYILLTFIAPDKGAKNVNEIHDIPGNLHAALVNEDEEIFRVLFFDISRWRTLLSVDDLVEDVVSTLDAQKLLEDTYIIFSSDNGFHLGKGLKSRFRGKIQMR